MVVKKPLGEMRVYIDPNADEAPLLVGYKGKIFETPPVVIAPYVPLGLMPEMPEIIDESNEGEYLFRLRCGFDSMLPNAERAMRWIDANVPITRYRLTDCPTPNVSFKTRYGVLDPSSHTYSANRDLLIEFYNQKDAALFKLMFI